MIRHGRAGGGADLLKGDPLRMREDTLYTRCVLPRLTHLVMGHGKLKGPRHRVAGNASGLTIEIGFGSGRNLAHYPGRVETLIGVDPSAALLAIAARSPALAGPPVHLMRGIAERLPLPDAIADTVVVCWTLCSVDSPAAALAEIRRILKPTGQLLFVEHGLAADAGVRRWQHRLTPVWRHAAGGCHLDRPIDALIVGAGFRMHRLAAGYIGRPRFLSYFFEGRAVPA